SLIGRLDVTFNGKLAVDCYNLTYCSCKALIYLDPLPPGEDLDVIYRKANQFTSNTYTDPERIAAIVSYMSSCLSRILSTRTVPLAQPAAIMEIGAGFAWMCRAAKQLNDSTKTIAQDVSAEVASKCGWVDEYLVCDMSDQRLDMFGPYDLI